MPPEFSDEFQRRGDGLCQEHLEAEHAFCSTSFIGEVGRRERWQNQCHTQQSFRGSGLLGVQDQAHGKLQAPEHGSDLKKENLIRNK